MKKHKCTKELLEQLGYPDTECACKPTTKEEQKKIESDPLGIMSDLKL